MRISVSAIAFALCCVTARGDSVTIDFASLDGQNGQVIASYSSQGFTVLDPSGMTIVGSASPDYLGQTGVIPSNSGVGGFPDIFMSNYPANYFLESFSVEVGPANGSSQAIDLNPYVFVGSGNYVTSAYWSQTITGVTTFTLEVNQEVNLIDLLTANGDTYPQILSITIDFTPNPASVPEPSSLSLIGVGLAGLVVLSRRRGARRRR